LPIVGFGGSIDPRCACIMLSDADLQHFAATTDELLAVVLADGSFVAHNAAWTRLLGHDEAALRATRLPELTTGDARAALIDTLELAAGAGPGAGGRPRLFPLRGVDGHVHSCEMSLDGGADGRVRLRGRTLHSEHAVGDRSRADLLAQVIDTAPFILWQIDRDGTFVLSEGGGLAKLGLAPGQVVGMSAFAVYQGDPSVVESLRRGLAGEEGLSKSQAGDLHFANHARPLRDRDGEVVGLMGVPITCSICCWCSSTSNKCCR
jgi:PAS domain-containing protein